MKGAKWIKVEFDAPPLTSKAAMEMSTRIYASWPLRELHCQSEQLFASHAAEENVGDDVGFLYQARQDRGLVATPPESIQLRQRDQDYIHRDWGVPDIQCS